MKFEDLLGEIFTDISGANHHSEVVLLTSANNKIYKMWHQQDCCEGVWLEDVVGDINDLIGEPIIDAREEFSSKDDGLYASITADDESYTWTFYHLATKKGFVTFRWYGTSNGYYSESAEIIRLEPRGEYDD